jgi:hypothetical protein
MLVTLHLQEGRSLWSPTALLTTGAAPPASPAALQVRSGAAGCRGDPCGFPTSGTCPDGVGPHSCKRVRCRVRAADSVTRGPYGSGHMWVRVCGSVGGLADCVSCRRQQVVTAHRTSATLAWRAPEENGGSPVTCFEVRRQARARATAAHASGLPRLARLVFLLRPVACRVSGRAASRVALRSWPRRWSCRPSRGRPRPAWAASGE